MCACSRNSKREQQSRTDVTTTITASTSASANRMRILVTALTLIGISPQLVAPFVTQSCTLAPTRPAASTARRHSQRSRQGDALLNRRRLSHVAAAAAAAAVEAAEAPATASPETSPESREIYYIEREPVIQTTCVSVCEYIDSSLQQYHTSRRPLLGGWNASRCATSCTALLL